MELKSALSYILLVILHFIDIGEASSEDERGRTVRRNVHRWTPGEELKLIFFDVSTDTGEKNHFNRIREEWRREYPELDVSDSALRNKILRLREESLEGRGKQNSKWNAELEQELVDVYHTTRPYVKDANVSLDEEWKRRYPDFQGTGKYLLWRIRELFRKYNYLKYRIPGSSMALSLVGDKTTRVKHRWTEHERARLQHFQKLMSEKQTQPDKVISLWREEFPESNVTDNALFHRLRILRRASREKGVRRKFLVWTPEDDKLLLETYLNTYPYRKDVNVTFGEVWKQRQEGSLGDEEYLFSRARKLLRYNKYSDYVARSGATASLECGAGSQAVREASPDDEHGRKCKRKLHRWTIDEEMRLIFFDVSTDTGEKNHIQRIIEEWRREYPESGVSDKALRRKISALREESLEGGAKKTFKWDAELEQDLVGVYCTTRPYVKDANLSLDEEWKRRHPEFQGTGGYLLWRVKRLFGRHSHLRYKIPGVLKNFKWNAKLEQELVDVYHTTRPYVKGANVSLDEEWKRRHPDFQGTGEYLLWRIKRLFGKYNYLRYRIPGSSIESSLVEDKAGRAKHGWTEHEKARLLHLQKLTSKGGRMQLDKIKSLWREEFPESNVTDIALSVKLRDLRKALRKGSLASVSPTASSERNSRLDEQHASELSDTRNIKIGGDEGLLESRTDDTAPSPFSGHKHNKMFHSFEPSHVESQAGPSRLKVQKRNEPLPKMKSLEGILGGQKGAESEKRFGKAPMVYSPEESASSSFPMTSGDSE